MPPPAAPPGSQPEGSRERHVVAIVCNISGVIDGCPHRHGQPQAHIRGHFDLLFIDRERSACRRPLAE